MQANHIASYSWLMKENKQNSPNTKWMSALQIFMLSCVDKFAMKMKNKEENAHKHNLVKCISAIALFGAKRSFVSLLFTWISLYLILSTLFASNTPLLFFYFWQSFGYGNENKRRFMQIVYCFTSCWNIFKCLS